MPFFAISSSKVPSSAIFPLSSKNSQGDGGFLLITEEKPQRNNRGKDDEEDDRTRIEGQMHIVDGDSLEDAREVDHIGDDEIEHQAQQDERADQGEEHGGEVDRV